MNMHTVRSSGPILALVIAAGLGGCQSSEKSSNAAAASAKVNPSNLQAAAKAPAPAHSQQRSSIGQGALSINTSNSQGDADSFWVGEFDIDGDGDLEETQFLWDDEDKVLYAYAETDVWCESGGVATAAILGCVNGAGNPRGRGAGSGFYAVYFDASECAAQVAGIYACTFNSKGDVTEWAAATVNSGDDSVILSRGLYNPTKILN